MKNFNFLVLFALALGFGACSSSNDGKSDIDEPLSPSEVALQEMKQTNEKVVPFIELDREHYHYIVNLTSEKALELGISQKEYDRVIKEILEVNHAIDSLRAEGIDVDMYDPATDDDQEKDNPSMMSRAFTDPVGWLTAYSYDEVQSQLLFYPTGMRGIEFRCRSNVALSPLFSCKLRYGGQWIVRTGTTLNSRTKTIQVPSPTSNEYGIIAFRTSDVNGGEAFFCGYDKASAFQN